MNKQKPKLAGIELTPENENVKAHIGIVIGPIILKIRIKMDANKEPFAEFPASVECRDELYKKNLLGIALGVFLASCDNLQRTEDMFE